MPKPLLTDEIIEKAKREREQLERNLQREMKEDETLAEKYIKIEQKLSKHAVYKSRRIENVKQRERNKKVNKWLWIVVLIVVVLGVLFFWYYFL